MQRIVGACGIVCSECSAYLATQSGDPAALQRVVEQWTEEHHNPNITLEGVICDGCFNVSGRYCFYCAHCCIRACAVERGVANCAHCEDYACEQLIGFLEMVPDARAVLDEIRAGLTAS